MNALTYIPFLKSKKRAPEQVSSNSWFDRTKVLNENINLFCWERVLDGQIEDYLKAEIEVFTQPIVFSTTQDDLPAELTKARKNWDDSHKPEADVFWRDVYRLVNDFLDFSENHAGTVHLRVVSDNACSKFHTDAYRLRLFTTYIGQGTEWLPEDAVNRAALGTTNERIVKDVNLIRRVGAGHVAILKGEPRNQVKKTKGIVHRSPQIVQTGGKRIILRVDI